jgi:hypothetical protein
LQLIGIGLLFTTCLQEKNTMHYSATFSRSAFAAGIFLFAACALAGNISGVKIEPANATVGQQVKITVSGEDEGICGLRVEYGNGDVDVTKMNAGRDNFPRSFMKAYNKAGTYTVVAKGGKDGSAFGCTGESKATVTVSEAPKPAAAAPVSGAAPGAAKAAPTCPDGFALNSKSVDGKTGAYTCTGSSDAKKPEKGAECPTGTAYFYSKNSKGVSLGCKKAPPAKKA